MHAPATPNRPPGRQRHAAADVKARVTVIDVLRHHGHGSATAGRKLCCPLGGHEDRHPSCEVSADGQGLTCWSHPGGEAHYDAIGLEQLYGGGTAGEAIRRLAERHGLAPVAPVVVAKPAKPARTYTTRAEALEAVGRKAGTLAAIYEYGAGPGYQAFTVARFDEGPADAATSKPAKTFRPMYADAAGRWHLGDPPGPLPLYCREAVAAAVAAKRRVYVVEGEKCADALNAIGLAATTSAHGSKSAGRTDWSPLAGADVCHLPDRDPPGEAFAADVGAALASLTPPATMRVVRLSVLWPELPPAGDVVDFIAWRRDDLGAPDSELRAELTAAAASAPCSALAVIAPASPAPAASADTPTAAPDTDLEFARLIVRQHGDQLRFCGDWGKWLAYDAALGRWELDTTGAAERAAKATTDSLATRARELSQAATTADPAQRQLLFSTADTFYKAHGRFSTRRALEAGLALAASEAELVIRHKALDAAPHLLNCRNGTLNLDTGELLPHDPRHLLTKVTGAPYVPAAPAPQWAAFLADILPDAAVREYVQRALGYCLLGAVREHLLLILHGTGANGKSALMEAVQHAVGDYGGTATSDLLIATAGDRHLTEIADLLGKRLVVCSETPEGGRLDEAKVKRLTGGDRLKARRMREDLWEFEPTHKLVMLTNHQPRVTGTDHGIWRRLVLVPFTVTIAADKQDTRLGEKLLAEAPGVLAWLVAGYQQYAQRGLSQPPAVMQATSEYRADEDTFGDFLAACTLPDASAHTTSAALRAAYAAWAGTPVSAKTMAARLTNHGHKPRRGSGGTRVVDGLRLQVTHDASLPG